MTIDPPFDPLMERLQQAVAPDYRVEHRIGEGGMGVVYRAHEVLMNRGAAIKVLRPELGRAEAAQAFLREAQMMGSVRHKNVVVIYRPGEGKGLQFYIMELVNGSTLERRLEAGPIPRAEVVRIGSDLLYGLQEIHRLGFVHRDIKPSNVFALSDVALISDFGIAQPRTDQPDERDDRRGTPDYMAPEQINGGPLARRCCVPEGVGAETPTNSPSSPGIRRRSGPRCRRDLGARRATSRMHVRDTRGSGGDSPANRLRRPARARADGG